ncbi:MAG: DNA translocase FtsK [Gammaproteobacteria bacterium]
MSAQASREGATPATGVWATVLGGPLARGGREGAFIVLVATALYLLLALVTYHPADPGWSHSGPAEHVFNQGGIVGAWLADVFLYLFGYLAYLFPLMVAYAGWLIGRGVRSQCVQGDLYEWVSRSGGFVLTVGAGCALATLHAANGGPLPVDAGGILGNVVGHGLARMLAGVGSTLFLLALFLTGFTLCTNLSWLTVMDVIGARALALWRFGFKCAFVVWCWARDRIRGLRARRERTVQVHAERVRIAERRPLRIDPPAPRIEPSPRARAERQRPLFEPPPDSEGRPSLSLLDDARASGHVISEAALEAMSRQVELKLADFGVEVEVTAVLPGPVVTRYELLPAPGLKVSKVSSLAKDLARSLSTISVRIVEVIPGKSVIGLEIPNEHRELVVLSEVLRAEQYEQQASALTLALGKDISGLPTVADLARMPHLLVAGTTGSGKSVAINAMVLSLLYKASAADVRLIMIDPKMLELSVYEGIPHLLAPVVTDMRQASNALRWCVAEMERRYQLMSAMGVRNIGGYNRKVNEARQSGSPIRDPLFTPMMEGDEAPELENLPFIVVVIDELADLMMVTGKKVEELIARLAQKARASGIHLIVATQRPSVDVITGLIKANIPSRIAFQVSSKIDSRTIIDQMGAENLLGHGDMLFVGPGSLMPTRVHGAFVSDQEVHRIVDSLKAQGMPQYLDEILDGSSVTPEMAGSSAPLLEIDSDGESDALYDQAVRIVTETRRASISGVQRRLKVGYNRAARMLEQMEESGVVGPLQPNGSREIIAQPPPAD